MRRFVTIISLVAATTLVAGCWHRAQDTTPVVNEPVNTNQPPVNEPVGEEPVAEAWMSYSPKQCQQNPWEQWDAKSGWSSNKRFASPEAQEQSVLTAWLAAEYNVTLKEYHKKITSEMVCQACSCPRGDQIAIRVNGAVKALVASGWTDMGMIGCTKEAKSCPGGGVTGRVAPWCEFAPCATDVQIDVQVE